MILNGIGSFYLSHFFAAVQFNIQRRSDAEAQLGSSPIETPALEFEARSFDKGYSEDQTLITLYKYSHPVTPVR